MESLSFCGEARKYVMAQTQQVRGGIPSFTPHFDCSGAKMSMICWMWAVPNSRKRTKVLTRVGSIVA
jgi:hypothetical protein